MQLGPAGQRAVPAISLRSLPAFRQHGPQEKPATAAGTPAIVQEEDGAAVLRRVAAEVPPDMFGSPQLRQLAASMTAVMRAAPGVGLAAPQIDMGLQVIVAEDREEHLAKMPLQRRQQLQREPFPPRVVCNPRLRALGAEGFRYWEGCLSVGGYQALVERYTAVEVSGQDLEGSPICFQAHGWQARIWQHECDHVRGVLYIDRAVQGSFMVRAPAEEAEAGLALRPGPCTCCHALI